ncbi:hypothetical protein FOL47_004269 [Perkinsus chesapeaki]|uniref:Uncharacterized protein n=1 Tax=Perkinsus chesapeaki TaxID=330153 RepID=A0A7J6M4M3_PERCH|nr:hypothetical protein FOL47_004269 [Perkinsus chesapeaki]
MRVAACIPVALGIFEARHAIAITAKSVGDNTPEDASDDVDWGTDLDGSSDSSFDTSDAQQKVDEKHEEWAKIAEENEKKRLAAREEWQEDFTNKSREIQETLDFPTDVPPVPTLESVREAKKNAAASSGDQDSDDDDEDDSSEPDDSESYLQEAAHVKINSTDSQVPVPTQNVTQSLAKQSSKGKANSFVDLDAVHPSVADSLIYKRAKGVLNRFQTLQDRIKALGQVVAKF